MRKPLAWSIALFALILAVTVGIWPSLFERAVASRPILSVILLVAGLLIALWKIPQIQVARSPEVAPEKCFDSRNEARKTLAQIIGGSLLLFGLYSSQETLKTSQEALKTSQEGQITDRYTKTIEQLGAVEPGPVDPKTKQPTIKAKLEVRLGAIYALERIAQDSERDHWPIMEVLTFYVRKNAPLSSVVSPDDNRESNIPRIKQDIQAILTVLGRRNEDYDKGRHLDLSRTNLIDANLEKAKLNNANLYQANLKWANLKEAHFSGADLREAWFMGRAFEGADFSKAKLSQAFLMNSNLTGSNLTQIQLDNAVGDGRTILPVGLHRPQRRWQN
jgi:hypothetical protein